MPEFHVTRCTIDQYGALAQNAWKYAKVKCKHICIRPGTHDKPINPPGPVNCTAEIEVLASEDKTLDEADKEAQKIVLELFGNVL